eukprot:jgi/Galph1/3736/GphlegSOOS_G2428.1
MLNKAKDFLSSKKQTAPAENNTIRETKTAFKLENANTSKVVLSFSLKNLTQEKENFDCIYVVVYETWVDEGTTHVSLPVEKRKELGRTETMAIAAEVSFYNTIDLSYTFEDPKALYIEVFKQKAQENISVSDRQRQLCGEQIISVGQLLVRFGCFALLPLLDPQSVNNMPTEHDEMIEITAKEPSYVKNLVTMHLAAAKLRKPVGFFGTVRPILIIRRRPVETLSINRGSTSNEFDENFWETVYESEPVKDGNVFATRDIGLQRNIFDFGRVEIFEAELNQGNVEHPLQLEIVHLKKTGHRSRIGVYHTTEKFLSQQEPNTLLPLEMNHFANPSPPGYLLLLRPLHARTLRTFLDFIVGGCELRMIVAIDFTASNGNPKQPGTLHYCDNSSRMNEYERAIREVAATMLHYEVEQHIACYGFGARLPPHQKTLHCFPLTLDEKNPYFQGLEDLIAGYHSIIKSLEFHGPTVLAEVIKTAADISIDQFSSGHLRYSVLFILTDGAISDVTATMEQVRRAAECAPLSIVVIGIGSNDFQDMRFLTDCEKMERSIFQFVAYRQFNNTEGKQLNVALRKALANIPQQLLSFMKLAQVKPRRPSRRSLKLYPEIIPATAPIEHSI